MAPLNGGVLIIGSLFWDEAKIRKEWQAASLDLSAVKAVAAPIRYGRISESRHFTYTMVFSSSVPIDGKALAVPLRNPITSFGDLELQVKSLAEAENLKRNVKNPFFWGWGCVGLLLNPAVDVKREPLASILITWQKKFEGFDNARFFLEPETSTIDRNGFLQIEWPTDLALDFLLATVVKPDVHNNAYPDAGEVFRAMNKAVCFYYFIKNVEHGITTFQDDEIAAKLRTSKNSLFWQLRART